MKITFITLIRIKYYYAVFCLMRNLRPHIVDKDAVQMYEYWEVVYQQKISRLLKEKLKKFES